METLTEQFDSFLEFNQHYTKEIMTNGASPPKEDMDRAFQSYFRIRTLLQLLDRKPEIINPLMLEVAQVWEESFK